MKSKRELEEDALALWGDQGNPLDFMVTSAGSVGYTPLHCERCEKRFRPWRKMIIAYNKTEQKWKCICKECTKPDDCV